MNVTIAKKIASRDITEAYRLNYITIEHKVLASLKFKIDFMEIDQLINQIQ
jgi:hypothetical protein